MAEAQAYAALDTAGMLTQHTSLWAPIGGPNTTFQAWLAFATSLSANGKVHIVAFKGFLDGTLAARTGALLAPYADDSTTSGALVYSPTALANLVVRANRAGYPVALHAIGDRAVRAALDAFATSVQVLGQP